MPYFQPLIDGQFVMIYTCPGCQGHFGVGSVTVSCAVLHAPGTCCHVGEHELEPGLVRLSPAPVAPSERPRWP
jgi:hypothetical protein